MSITVKRGNLFNAETQTIVNTVNCVGAMGKGIALIFRLQYPNMYQEYKKLCNQGSIQIGKLWIYKEGTGNDNWILNFPTKDHWKYPSKIDYLEKGLREFLNTYKKEGITSIAFPLLGSNNGGLDKVTVLNLMKEYLSKCDIPIEIYQYDPSVKDKLYVKFSQKWQLYSLQEIKSATGIRINRITKISEVIEDGKINSMIDLINVKGIGLKTMQKCYAFIQLANPQSNLFE